MLLCDVELPRLKRGRLPYSSISVPRSCLLSMLGTGVCISVATTGCGVASFALRQTGALPMELLSKKDSHLLFADAAPY